MLIKPPSRVRPRAGPRRRRRCDLEAVAYVAMYLHEGRLPWSDLPAKTGPEPDVRHIERRYEVPPAPARGAGLVDDGRRFEATRSLHHAERPDYAALKGC